MPIDADLAAYFDRLLADGSTIGRGSLRNALSDLCTPHIAAVPRPEVAAAQFLDNLRRARNGEPLRNLVDRSRGY